MAQETTFKLNTENGMRSFTTEEFNGQLDSIIIDADAKTEVIIESKLGYTLLHKHDCFGVLYLPLRVQTIDNKGWGGNYQNAKYYLKEQLTITIIGQRNKDISFRFRFS